MEVGQVTEVWAKFQILASKGEIFHQLQNSFTYNISKTHQKFMIVE
jgi:hypothetical protein